MNIFQLYGATLVDRNMDISGAIHIWTEALEYGFPNDKRERHEVYDGLTEIDSYADIRNVIGDPDAMRMQVVISQIFGRPDQLYILYVHISSRK